MNEQILCVSAVIKSCLKLHAIPTKQIKHPLKNINPSVAMITAGIAYPKQNRVNRKFHLVGKL